MPTAASHLTDPEIEALAQQLRTLSGNEHVGAPIGVVYGEHYATITYSLSPFTVYFLPDGADPGDVTAALTGRAPQLVVPKIRAGWTRKGGQPVLTNTWRALAAAKTGRFGGEQLSVDRHDLEAMVVPWGELSGRDVPAPVWVDEEALHRYQQMLVEHQARVQVVDALREQAEVFLRSIAQAWERRAVDAAKDRYLADFVDLDGWEQHLGTLTDMTYTGSVRWHDGGRRDWLHRLVLTALESGVPLEGHTVADILAAVGGVVPPVRDQFGSKDLPVRSDVLDLPFTTTASST